MNFEKLEKFLKESRFSNNTSPIGFLEIINRQTYENINSLLYAHFLSCGNEFVENGFLNALVHIIEQKSNKRICILQPTVRTEVQTVKGNRIDICIHDLQTQNAIIIENKLHHILDNDLLDYWNHFLVDENKKIGVLLTLEPLEIPIEVQNKFINITHIEWINEIKKELDFQYLTENYRVYCTDFFNAIDNLTKSYIMNESVKFYFQNAPQIILAKNTLDQAHAFIHEQFQLIAQKIGWSTYGNAIEFRNFWDKDNELDTYLTILTKDLLNGKLNFTLILELNREDKEREVELQEKFKNHPQFIDKKRGESVGSYVHFRCKDYSITLEELENFSDFVVQKIHEDFAELTLDVIKYLYPDVNISNWENLFLEKIEDI